MTAGQRDFRGHGYVLACANAPDPPELLLHSDHYFELLPAEVDCCILAGLMFRAGHDVRKFARRLHQEGRVRCEDDFWSAAQRPTQLSMRPYKDHQRFLTQTTSEHVLTRDRLPRSLLFGLVRAAGPVVDLTLVDPMPLIVDEVLAVDPALIDPALVDPALIDPALIADPAILADLVRVEEAPVAPGVTGVAVPEEQQQARHIGALGAARKAATAKRQAAIRARQERDRVAQTVAAAAISKVRERARIDRKIQKMESAMQNIYAELIGLRTEQRQLAGY